MTQFIASFATQQLVPPWKSVGATTWTFVVRLTTQAVTTFLDSYFNGTGPANGGPLVPAPFHYRPVEGPQFAFLTVVRHPGAVSVSKTSSGQFGSVQCGWNRVPNTQIYMTLPVLRLEVSPANILLAPKVVWVQPFNYCDAASVVFSAREIWGADVEHVRIDCEETLKAPQLHLDVSYVGIEQFGPRSMNELLAGLHLRVGEGVPADPAQLAAVDPAVNGLVEQLVGFRAAKPPAGAEEGDPLADVEVNTLKQFRAAEDMGLAIYRAIVASRHTHTNVEGLTLHDPAQVQVDFLWAESLQALVVGLLGLEHEPGRGPPAGHFPVRPPPPQPPGSAPTQVRWDLDRMPVQPELCYSFTSDLHFEVIETLHVYRPQA